MTESAYHIQRCVTCNPAQVRKGSIASVDRAPSLSQLNYRALRCMPLISSRLVPQNFRRFHPRKSLLQDLKSFHGKFDLLEEYACDIACWPREIRYVTKSQRIVVDRDHHNWQRIGGRES